MGPKPALYPVVCFVTGTTPRGGGVWRDLLWGSPHGLLRRDLPLLTSALHFLDFRISPQALERWRRRPLRAHYDICGVAWEGELFVDSGGFALILDPDLDLARYGMPRERLPEEILRLQLDLGADRVASLDFPIPPGLSPAEAGRRMAMTLEAAVRTGRALAELPPARRPRWLVPVHGPTPEALAEAVRDTIARLSAEGLWELVEGLAIGSMVPRRRNGWVGEILAFVRAARRAAPEETPLHVFGMTGSIIPFLLREGATSFDSAAYLQNARHLQYVDPGTRRLLDLRALEGERCYPCRCRVCEGRDPRADLAVLRGERPGRKSAVYAAVALHNLEMDLSLFEEALAAWRAGALEAFLRELPRRFPTLRWPDAGRPAAGASAGRTFRPRSPDDFDLRRIRWAPGPQKRVLLLLPCSKQKPYPSSPSFRRVWRRVEAALGEKAAAVQVVFLSGLYGPVPLERAEDGPVTDYDFRLHPADAAGIARVAERLADLLRRTEGRFLARLAYLPVPAYRKAAEKAAASFPDLVIFRRRGDLPALLRALEAALG